MANWPTDAERAGKLSHEFHSIWDEIGESLFTRTVTKIIHESRLQFFPSCGEFRGFIPNANAKKFWRDPNCPDCKGTGFKMVADYDARQAYGNDTAMAALRCRRDGCLHVEA